MDKQEFFKQYIASIPDFPKPGINFRDITPTLENPDAFAEAIDQMAEIASYYDFNKIVCADARGFLFGAALGYRIHKGVVCARKPGKLPRPGISCSYRLEYGDNILTISQGSLKENDRCLVLDDLLATGGSALAMLDLVNRSRAIPVCALFYVELPDLKGREEIKKRNDIDVRSLVTFEGF